jgi:hypothetical protein
VAEELRQSLEAANRQLATSFREDLHRSLSEIGQVNEALRLVKELGDQTSASREEQARSLDTSRATFEKGAVELMGTMGTVARLQSDLAARLDTSARAFHAESRPASPPAAPPALPQEAARSLERVARGFESLSPEIERNNFLLGEMVRAHFFYRSMLRRPREWWDALRRLVTRRGEAPESAGLP